MITVFRPIIDRMKLLYLKRREDMAEPVYETFGACKHLDAGRLRESTLPDGRRLQPFFLLVGNERPETATPIQFVGNVCQEVTWQGIDHEGYHSAELAIVHFLMTANHPRFGRLTIVHDTSRPGGFGRIRAVNRGKPFPIIHTTRLHVTAVADELPGTVLQNEGPPLEFISEPSSQWPPENAVYTLQVNVNFQNRRDRAPMQITATSGSVLVGVRS